MPPPDAILENLTLIANGWMSLAIGWHAVVAMVAFTIAMGWRPTSRTVAVMSLFPFVSVSTLAWSSGNPFNGATFAMLAILLGGFAVYASTEPIRASSSVFLVCGVVLVGFGWIYPHFLNTTDWRVYLYSAPLGLVPCPTLALVLGATLMIDGHISKWWAFALSMAGVMYGTVGVFALHVRVDTVLLAGAAVLAASASRIRTTAGMNWA